MARILHIGQKVENFQAFGSGIERYQNVKHVFIKALQIQTRRKFELRLSTLVHLLENLKQSNLTFSKTCAF